MESFYWFDFETFGANPSKDRASQFAGVRTDLDFNIIGEPLNIICKPAPDFLPSPEACLVTGITPQFALENGLIERDFFRQINLELSIPNTCAVGYNNIRFDDEVIRHGFYRNFYDAYAREWQNGNSRWDILDMLRLMHALRPEGIEWPTNEEGNSSFRLEILSQANGILHDNAHDALSDVYATIGMAKLVKEKQPRLFEYLFSLRDKRNVAAEINLVTKKPFVHCSGMLGPEHQYTGVMMPLAAHPTNKNSVICIDLCKDFPDLEDLTAEDFSHLIFTKKEELKDNESRLPIKEIHFNKCPAIAPLGVLNRPSQERLSIDLELCLTKARDLYKKIVVIEGNLLSAFQQREFKAVSNPDYALYSGGFFSASDKQIMDAIRKATWSELTKAHYEFSDGRLPEMLFRYRARNAPETLSLTEAENWKSFCYENVFEPIDRSPSFDDYIVRIGELYESADKNERLILEALEEYGHYLMEQLENERI